jgi:hypothetical protein
MVTFWPVAVVSVKPDAVTLPAVPTEPPAAGPDRALDPWPPDPKPPPPEPRPPLLVVVLLLAAVVALLEVASTIPYEPPAITTAAIPAATTLDLLLENISLSSFSWAVNLSYASPRWSFSGGKLEAHR